MIVPDRDHQAVEPRQVRDDRHGERSNIHNNPPYPQRLKLVRRTLGPGPADESDAVTRHGVPSRATPRLFRIAV
jgi:hypothetical protein